MQALLTFVAIGVTSLLTYLFTRRNEFEKHKRMMVTQAYADYLRGVAEGAHLNLDSNHAQVMARVADAKARICLYGSPEVIASLAKFESAGGEILNSQQHELFASLVLAMRGDSKVPRNDMELILFGGRAA